LLVLFQEESKMRNLLFILLIVFSALTLNADTITFSSPGPGMIHYESTGAVPPVAMALNVDANGTIVAVAVDNFFDIYMDAAHDMELASPSSYNYGDGAPIANQDTVGELALPSNEFCISMGGLGGETAITQTAPMSGDIILTAGTATSITITENALRGGIVGTDGEPMTVTGFPLVSSPPLDCMQLGGLNVGDPLYDDWVSVGKPECWCYPRQCHGDADGKSCGSYFTGLQYVCVPDLDVLAAAWLVKEPKVGKDWPGIASITGPAPYFIPGICADFARNKIGNSFYGFVRVAVPDLDAMSPHWLVKEPKVGKTWPGVPADCTPGTVVP
jgi:hypothetical protein